MVNIITIKNDTIPYLNENIIKAFEDVTLISTEGFTIKINSLLLAAMSPSLKKALKFRSLTSVNISYQFAKIILFLKQLHKLFLPWIFF